MRSTTTLLLKSLTLTLFFVTAGIPFKQLMVEGQSMCEVLEDNEYDAEDINDTYAYLACYKDGFDRYDFDWRRKGTSSWSMLTGDDRMRRRIENLSPNTTYEYRARYWCDGGWNDWSDNKEFTTTSNGGGLDCSKLTSNEYDAEDINDTYAWLACYKGGYDRYDFDWRRKGTSSWSMLTGDDRMRRRIEDLMPNTTYEYRARYWCDGEWNDWSDNKEFTTTSGGGGIDCSKLTSNEYDAEDINDTYAVLACYKNGYDRYDFDWRRKGTSSWSMLTGDERMSRRIENLSPNTTYEYRARYWCDGEWNDWSDNKEFTTTSGGGGNNCDKLMSDEYDVEDINDTYAYLACYKNGFERYDFDWRRKGTSSWSMLSGDDRMRRLIDNLMPNTTYEYRARYWCDGNWNEWSDNKEFTTTSGGGGNNCEKLTSDEYDVEDVNDTYAFLACYKNGFDRYDFDWREKGTSSWSMLTGDERMTRRIEDLMPNTTYEYRARYWCDGEWNEWSDNKEFTTTSGGGGDNCEKLTSDEYNAEDINDTYAFLACYKNGYERYDFDWREKGTSTWSMLTGDERMSRRIENLSPNTTYEYRARYWCNGEWNEWSDNKEFTTTSGGGVENCDKLTSDEYDSEDINDTYAYLACYKDGYERYDFDWRRKGTSSWSTLTGDERMRRRIENLMPNTTYEYRARYWCNGEWNEWSDNKEFMTTSSSGGETCEKLSSDEYDVEDINDTYAYLACYKNGYERYDFDWREKGTSDWSMLTGDERMRRRIEDLSPNTTYEYRARYWCEGEWNEWSDTKEFMTSMGSSMADCDMLTSNEYSAEDINDAYAYLVCYKEGYERYDFDWREKGSVDWSTLTGDDRPRRRIENLSSNTTYEFRARYWCEGDWNEWSDIKEFMTSMGQDICTPLVDGEYAAEEVSATSAYLACYREYDNYQFRYRTGFDDWTETETSSESRVLIEGLADNTTYEFQTRYTCGEDQFSAWSQSAAFMTEMLTNAFQFSTADWQLYPNPSTGLFNISLDVNTEPFTLTIFDMRGTQMLQQNLRGGLNHQVNIDLVGGIYVLQITQNDRVGIRKLIVR